MTKHTIFKVVAACVLVAALIGIGGFAFRAGVAQGMAVGAQVPAGEVGKALPYMYPYRMHGGHMFGFGIFALLVPLFLLFLAFGAFRALIGCGPHMVHRGYWGYPEMHHGMGPSEEGCHGVPPMFDEWHRKAHEKESASEPQEKDA